MADFSVPTTRNLPCRLTDDELLARGQQQAQALEEYDQAEADRKAAADQYKQRMTASWAAAQRLATCIRTKTEYRDVECSWSPDYKSGMVSLWRTDDGTMVDERKMTQEEMQAAIRFEDGKEGIDTAD